MTTQPQEHWGLKRGPRMRCVAWEEEDPEEPQHLRGRQTKRRPQRRLGMQVTEVGRRGA